LLASATTTPEGGFSVRRSSSTRRTSTRSRRRWRRVVDCARSWRGLAPRRELRRQVADREQALGCEPTHLDFLKNRPVHRELTRLGSPLRGLHHVRPEVNPRAIFQLPSSVDWRARITRPANAADGDQTKLQ